jgi:26S proteasome non-ATPase regulatory subunit 5
MEEIKSKLCSLLDSLPDATDKWTTVDEISLILSTISPATLKTVVPNLSFGTLFECLASFSSEEHLETCCKVLERLLNAVDPFALLSNFHSELLIGLDSECEIIRNLCLAQIRRVVENGDQQLVPYIDVIQKVVHLIGNSSLATSKQATQVTVCIGKTNDGVALLLGEQVLPVFESVLEQSDEARFRIYECIAEIAIQSVEGLQLAVSCGLLQRFLRELDSDDILTRLNCLEILTSVAIADHGLSYLHESGILQQLDDLIGNIDSDPFGELLLPGLVKLFGSMCRSRPTDILEAYKKFSKFLFDAVGGPVGSSITGVAVETIGFIGSNASGKLSLGQKVEMKSVCGHLGTLLINAPTQIRERVLETVTHLVNLQPSDQTPQLLSLTEDWFGRLTHSVDDSIKTVLSIAHQPFGELRITALRLVAALAALPWGLSHLIAHAGFLEYLLDRSTERGERDGLEAKYTIVSVIVGSPTASTIVPGEFFLRLREYERDGPFYVKHESHVAFESGQ